jgi:hypothetical protein
MILTGGKAKCSEKSLSLYRLIHDRFYVHWPGIEPGPPLVRKKSYKLINFRCRLTVMVIVVFFVHLPYACKSRNLCKVFILNTFFFLVLPSSTYLFTAGVEGFL